MKNLKIYLMLICTFFMLPIFSQGEGGESIKDIILGDITMNFFLAMLLFAVIGVIVNLVSDVHRRDKPSPHSPKKWSFKYWWADNWKRLAATTILLPVSLLMTTELFGVELTKGVAFGIGFGADHLVEIAKRKKMKLLAGAGVPTPIDSEAG